MAQRRPDWSWVWHPDPIRWTATDTCFGLLTAPSYNAEITSLLQIAWLDCAAMPVAKSGMASGMVASRLVLAGGSYWVGDNKVYLDRVDVYDSQTDRWSLAPPLPRAMAYGASCLSHSDLLAIGGTDGRTIYRDCWRQRDCKAWERTGAFPNDRLVLSRAVVTTSGIVLFCAAEDPNRLDSASADVFIGSLDGAKWRKVSAIPHGASCLLAAAAVGNHVYLFGGCFADPHRKVVNRGAAACFDPIRNKWTPLRPLPQPVRGASAVAFQNSILILGGYVAGDRDLSGMPGEYGYTRSVWVYNIRDDRYTEATPLPFGVMGAEFFLFEDVLHGAGGEHNRNRGRSSRTLAGSLRYTA